MVRLVFLAAVATGAAVALVIGIRKLWGDVRTWHADQDRDKNPWERPNA